VGTRRAFTGGISVTVADNTSRNQYTATSGQTVFAYTFEIVDKDDVVVLKNGTTLSEGTDYAVSNVGNDSGGNVTLTVGATASDVLTLYRDMPYARTQNYTNSGDFLASEVNSDFDELWLASEQTNRSFEQSVRKPITDSDTISMELPEASSRANKLLGFDANGAVSTSLVTDDAQTIAGIADDIETLAHIQDGTVATDAITNVNTIRTDVTAVSGVASDVTAVAGNTANINTVATDLTGADDIGTVAGSITNVNTVAGDIANVNSVAGNATNINTVAADLSGADDIGTVAGSISSVNTVAPDINHVVTVSGDLAGADNIGTVATNISNVNTVGGISSDVTTVAGISTEVTAVSSNSANINTVGTNITNVNNVGSNIANVNTVAGLETEINAVVADEADIGVVGANITSVNTVSSNINSVNAVYNNMADVNNAAANATAAAASAADANTSAGAAATSASAASTSASNASSSESAALTSANNASQSAATASLSASAAATSATNASSSAANAATSESNADNSETAAAISASNASSSASTASNNAIAAASSATSASNSASQAASSASAAATSASNSETAADTWNSYYSTYLGASATAPSYDLLGQPLQNGALYFNTTNDTMYVFNGSIWIAAESTINIVSVPTQLAADLTTNGNDIIFGDNDRAKFGAGSDLQIYHDGSNSYIVDSGTGSLNIRGQNQIDIENADGSQVYARFNLNGETLLTYAGAEKLATTSTGIDVTGTVTADGLTVDGTGTITNTSAGVATALSLKNNTAGANNRTAIDLFSANTKYVTLEGGYGASSPTFNLKVGNPPKLVMSADGNGDVSFYEDTGTTAKFFWDASAESLGIGTTSTFGRVSSTKSGAMSPAIDNFDGIGYSLWGSTSAGEGQFGGGIAFQNGSVKRAQIGLVQTGSDNDQQGLAIFTHPSGTYADDLQQVMTIGYGADGNVGIGTTSPAENLVVSDASDPVIRIENQKNDSSWSVGQSVGELNFYSSDNSGAGAGDAAYVRAVTEDIYGFDIGLVFGATTNGGAASTEAMRIDSSGNLLVGKTTVNSATTVGLELQADGQIFSIADARTAGTFIRKTSDGSIVDFRKDSTTVGTISAASTNVIYGNDTRGIKIEDSLIIPRDVDDTTADNQMDLGSATSRWKDLYLSGSVKANAISTSETAITFINSTDALHFGGSQFRPFSADDAVIDLGGSAQRFKDLYLSGGAYLGGTAAANKLDDYEEGTWTPVYEPTSGSFTTMTMEVSQANYTKVGNAVFITAYIRTDDVDVTGGSGAVQISGLPFSSLGSHSVNIGYAVGFVNEPLSGYVSGSVIRLQKRTGTQTHTNSTAIADLTDGTNADKNELVFSAYYVTTA
jgi:hypothetical protein